MKSLVLLFSRLALALLFVTVGIAQVQRLLNETPCVSWQPPRPDWRGACRASGSSSETGLCSGRSPSSCGRTGTTAASCCWRRCWPCPLLWATAPGSQPRCWRSRCWRRPAGAGGHWRAGPRCKVSLPCGRLCRLSLCSSQHQPSLYAQSLDGMLSPCAVCRQYQSHVRSHFATNLGAAGGLLLMQNYGAGQYTIDKLMKGNKQL